MTLSSLSLVPELARAHSDAVRKSAPAAVVPALRRAGSDVVLVAIETRDPHPVAALAAAAALRRQQPVGVVELPALWERRSAGVSLGHVATGVPVVEALEAPEEAPEVPEPVQEEAPTDFTCAVCYETKPLSERLQLLCCNDTKTCSDCFQESAQHAVRGRQGASCPNWECGAYIAPATLESMVPAEIVAAMREIELHRNTKRWCPNKTCSAPIPNADTGRVVTCAKCETRSCMRCRKGAHRGPCLKAKGISAGVSLWASTKDTKSCPRCSKLIEKNGGCEHMTCRTEAGGCGHEFCWLCKHNWHSHDGVHNFLCAPKAVWHGGSRYFGPIMPIRLVTKTAAVGLALGLAAGVVGACVGGAATVAVTAPVWVPAKMGVRKLKDRRRRRRQQRRQTKACSKEPRRSKTLVDFELHIATQLEMDQAPVKAIRAVSLDRIESNDQFIEMAAME